MSEYMFFNEYTHIRTNKLHILSVGTHAYRATKITKNNIHYMLTVFSI